jgi:20S proteasome subunit alpha 5
MYTRYQAKAIGSGSEGAQSSLQEQFRKDMTLKEAEVAALSILKQVMEEKVTNKRIKGCKLALPIFCNLPPYMFIACETHIRLCQ